MQKCPKLSHVDRNLFDLAVMNCNGSVITVSLCF